MKGRHLCQVAAICAALHRRQDREDFPAAFYEIGMRIRPIMKRRSSDAKVIVQPKPKPSKERPMDYPKYIGMDVHKATTVIAARNGIGKVVAEAIIETRSSTILDFIKSQRGNV